jgi:hypothetical protein
MRHLLLVGALLISLAQAQFTPTGGTAYGPWALDPSESKTGSFTVASKGGLIVYPNGLMFVLLDPTGDPYGYSYGLESGKGCVPLGHIPGARCELALEMTGGKVSVQSPSGYATAISWQASADGKTLTTEHTRVGPGDKSISKLVWRRPSPSVGLQPIRARTAPGTHEIVKNAVLAISNLAEGDPRIAIALRTLRDVPEPAGLPAIVSYLADERNTVRRSAIYILMDGPYRTIDPAVDRLIALCTHSEDITRGMAALALGAHRVRPSVKAVAAMATTDQSAYARRAAAFALGLMGDPAAMAALEQAVKDKDSNVASNAREAIEMLRSARAIR